MTVSSTEQIRVFLFRETSSKFPTNDLLSMPVPGSQLSAKFSTGNFHENTTRSAFVRFGSVRFGFNLDADCAQHRPSGREDSEARFSSSYRWILTGSFNLIRDSSGFFALHVTQP